MYIREGRECQDLVRRTLLKEVKMGIFKLDEMDLIIRDPDDSRVGVRRSVIFSV